MVICPLLRVLGERWHQNLNGKEPDFLNNLCYSPIASGNTRQSQFDWKARVFLVPGCSVSSTDGNGLTSSWAWKASVSEDVHFISGGEHQIKVLVWSQLESELIWSEQRWFWYRHSSSGTNFSKSLMYLLELFWLHRITAIEMSLHP